MIKKVHICLFIIFFYVLFFIHICNGIRLHNYKNQRINYRHMLSTIRNNVSINQNKQISKNNTKENKCNIMINYHDKSNIFCKSFFLSMEEKDCIKNIKKKIEEIYGIPLTLQEILYDNKKLENNITIQNIIKDKQIKILNLQLITILPHLFLQKDDDNNTNKRNDVSSSSSLYNNEYIKSNKRITYLKNKLTYYAYLTLLNEYKKLSHILENKKYILKNDDILESFKSFDQEFEKTLKNNNINLHKIKKEINKLKHIDKKKLLLRLEVDYPLMSNNLTKRIKQLFQYYYMGDITTIIKFSIFFYILYKYADYPNHIKKFFLYLSILFLISPFKPFYKFSHFLFFLVPNNILFSGFTNILSASYQQILMCQ
ncbi:ubiquitin [Plasmodium reichenowi]|uniref:Ubiquitin n=1 Tax=Plasmodium reichenowi TaxID=5854 RepID=A0A151LK14_PLARE|nr:ubiquitin [Plasmodium reichenowi]KYN99246.1 ubiquitin [Plasmodium reichenowi]